MSRRSARLHADGLTRCPWPGEDPFYMAYHDTEWGVPEYDDRALYEKLILDGFQAGLSWITILRKRDNFRKAFDDFRPEKIARYNAKKVHALMNDAGIVRNRAKIEGAINSAKSYLKIMEEGPGFSKFLWDFVDGKPKVNHFKTTASVPASTPLSIKMSKELAARGFKFVGPTIVYAFMQATGMVNDHLVTLLLPRNLRRKTSQPPPQSQMTAGKTVRAGHLHPRLAADAVGAAARSAGPLAARYRDRRYRPWPGAGRALERADQRRAYFLGGAAYAAGRSRDARADAARRCPLAARRAAARCAGICHRRHDLAVQGGARRRLQGGGKAAACRRSTSASGCRRCWPTRSTRQIKDADRGAAYLEATELAGFAQAEAKRLFGRDPGLPPATRAGLPDALDRGQGREAVPGAVQDIARR